MNILKAINHYNDNPYRTKPIWNFIKIIKNLFKAYRIKKAEISPIASQFKKFHRHLLI